METVLVARGDRVRTTDWSARLALAQVSGAPWLDVVVHRELVRRGPQPDRVDLVDPLPVHPGLDQVGREDVALEQVVVVLLQRAPAPPASEPGTCVTLANSSGGRS